MRIIRKLLIVSAILGLSPTAVEAAATCDQFKAAMIEGAAQYHEPPPQFRLAHVNSADPNIQYFAIAMFDDARAMLSCWYGEVGTFAVDANNTEPTSVLHTMLLAGMGLHGYGLEWRQALEVRDQLVSLAKASDRQMSEVHVEGGKVSLVISVAGVPSFQIDSDQ
jgi:hypothetical protein